MIWTDQLFAEACKLASAGYPASQIAKALDCGFTRSAIIGKFHRMGVALPGPMRSAVQKPVRVVPPPKITTYRERYPVVPKPKPNDEPEPSLIDEWEFLETEDLVRCAQVEDPTQRNVPLVDLAPGRCHWPVTGMETDAHLFCGDLAARRPYCETHRKLAYTPPPVFKRKRARTVTSQIAMGVNRIVA